MLALRPILGDKVEVQTIFFTKQRRGLFGWLCNQFMLWLSNSLIQELIDDDSKSLQTMQFNLRNPITLDQSIMQFINHLELQKPLTWKTWLLARSPTMGRSSSPDAEMKETQSKWRDELTND